MPGNLFPAPHEYPGWQEWIVGKPDQFNRTVMPVVLVRLDDPETARIRLIVKRHHSNVNEVIHGGAILSLIDISIFGGVSLLLGTDHSKGVTLSLQTQFMTPGDVSRPLDALVEVEKETGRMVFVRGTVVQDDDKVATYSAIMRKIR